MAGMKLRFRLQSMLWLTHVVGILLAWWADHRRLSSAVYLHKRVAEFAAYREAEWKARYEGNLQERNTDGSTYSNPALPHKPTPRFAPTPSQQPSGDGGRERGG